MRAPSVLGYLKKDVKKFSVGKFIGNDREINQ